MAVYRRRVNNYEYKQAKLEKYCPAPICSHRLNAVFAAQMKGRGNFDARVFWEKIIIFKYFTIDFIRSRDSAAAAV